MKIRLLMITLFFINLSFLYAEESGEKKKEKGVIVIPAIYSTPETSLVLGVFGMGYDKKGRGNNPDTLQAGGLFSLKNQKKVFILSQKTFDKTSVIAEASLQSWPYLYFKRGETNYEYEDYTDNSIRFKIKAQREIVKKWNIGSSWRGMYAHPSKLKNGGVLQNYKPFGIEKEFISGVGINLDYDSRNSTFYPTDGEYLQTELTLFNNVFGSSLDFIYGIIDMRKYIPVYKENCFAFQFFFNGTEGEVPLQYMPTMNIRGFFEGRFNDKCHTAFQGEYRFNIYKWLGGVVFAGAGETVPSIDELSFENLHSAYGAGLRFNTSKEDRLNIRFDYALNNLKGKDESKSGVYINFGEVF